MAYFHNIYCWFLYFLWLKGLESANIYVIDVPVEDKDTTLYYEDFEINNNYNRFKFAPEIFDKDSEKANIVMCQRLFGSIHGNKHQHIRCIEALKKHYFDRSKGEFYQPQIRSQESHDHPGRQHYKPFLDLTKFSQDYLDVNDLARSDIKTNEYVDINDFGSALSVVPQCEVELDEFGQITKTNCFPPSRKTLSNDDIEIFEVKVEDSSESDESKVDNEASILRKKKHKRYQVVSKESDKSRSDSMDSDRSAEDKADNVVEDNSGSTLNSDSSMETTTQKPMKRKRKTKNKEFNDEYMYIQGNKLYDKDDFRRNKLQYFRDGNDIERENKKFLSRFRRRLRMSHFLPKRNHWDEDQYQNLGYYWFNGPQGTYRNWRTR